MDQDGFLTENNKVDHFIDGNDLYDQVLKDIKNAKEYIHLEYYTFALDGLGKRILHALEEKLKQGLEVKYYMMMLDLKMLRWQILITLNH